MGIATIHSYQVGTTAELTREQEGRLSSLLAEFSREDGQKYALGFVMRKLSSHEVEDFTPESVTWQEGADRG